MRLGPMETITTLSVVLLAVLALAVILEDRSLMYEFLLGNQQPRNAQRIWHEMRGWKNLAQQHGQQNHPAQRSLSQVYISVQIVPVYASSSLGGSHCSLIRAYSRVAVDLPLDSYSSLSWIPATISHSIRAEPHLEISKPP